ncbi:DUF3455 domain-containing protein [Piscinibacter koreensis]|uniref:DUF3455 domain-containing protein n=1 Tax=Piscinibacter koreensis TaxID=2742824 RepID=A0A7Y6TXR8_9BURK|nr:DUF3455 domain-containing protein [Schlegelella koreensis]NUZ07340.1 DUF3455 domain-containing protein [Schlegelella koreensis]
MKHLIRTSATCVGVAVLLAVAAPARADVVTDWNMLAGDWIVQAKIGTPPANRVMAIVQTAVHEAVNAAELQHPGDAVASAAAVAAANRASLVKLLPQQAAAIAGAYDTAIGRLADGTARSAGIAAGEQAAARVLAWRSDDGANAADRYRPHAAPGAYVPTTGVAAPQWPQRKLWLMRDGAQFRPGPPPALDSATWARDYNEVKALGSKASRERTPEQNEIARFWEYSLPPIYHAVLRSVAAAPGRSVAQNARLFAAASQAMDDALIAVLDAKYHYGFWRPVTAIRNGDRDGSPATDVEHGWVPLIDNPTHPEYPSAHSILAGALGELLKAEAGGQPMPELATSSPTAGGATRRWASVDAFTREVAHARIWEGIHYRTSVEVGLDMGRRIGALAVQQVAQAPATAGVPQALAPRGASTLIERVVARGVQIYECRPEAGAAAGGRWVLVAPEAELLDARGAAAGRHGGGPTWEAFDGSRIVGTVEARADAPQGAAIPWLLLSTRSVGGAGRFSRVSHVQRVNTTGGVAPQRACDGAAHGASERVPYTADYLFYAS